MFSTVCIDIPLVFVQLGLENFGKIIKDPLLLPSKEYDPLKMLIYTNINKYWTFLTKNDKKFKKRLTAFIEYPEP